MINTLLSSTPFDGDGGDMEDEMDAAITATILLVFAVVCSVIWVVLSEILSAVARTPTRLIAIKKDEARYLLAALALFLFIMSLAYLAADTREATWAEWEWDAATEDSGLDGAVLPVDASEVTADASKVDPTRGEGAMSCPVGTGLILIREAVMPAEEPRLPRVVAAAFDPTSGSIHKCADDEQNITQCDAFGNYAFDFYATRALREISMETQHLACEPFDIFEARRIFRSFLLREERTRQGRST